MLPLQRSMIIVKTLLNGSCQPQRLLCSPHSKLSSNVVLCLNGKQLYLSRVTPRRWVSSLGYTIHPVCPVDLNCQSIPLPEPGQPVTGATPRAAAWGTPAGNPAGFVHNSKARTIYENFLNGHNNAPDHMCMGTRNKATGKYEWITYTEALERAHAFAAGLIALGAQPGQKTSLGIYARSCAEWDLAAIGCTSQAIKIVSMYDSMSMESISYIQQQAKLRYLIVEDVEKANLVLSNISETPHLQTLIVIDSSEWNLLKKTSAAAGANVTVISFGDVVKRGLEKPQPISPAQPEDVYIVCYTSGTTGEPKGALISHRAIMSVITAFQYYTEHYTGIKHDPNSGYTILSFLPLAHMFAQLMHGCLFYFSCRVGYYSGDVANLADDAQALRPMTMAVVPRILNRLHDQVQHGLAEAGPIKRAIFNFAFRQKFAQLKAGSVDKDTFWDRLIFNKIQARLGGRLEVLVTGSAPISAEVLNFCRVVLSCQIIEGYGQTECCACATGTMPLDFTGGHVGPVFPATHIKLKDVPEMEYWTKNNEGEICIHGPALMNGYFEDPARTEEAFDADGWLLSGDVGRWLPNGTLQVIDRKKHILKLSQGEYVAPERVETVYSKHPLIEQIYVEGDSLESCLVAIIVPSAERLRALAKATGLPSEPDQVTIQQLCSDRALITASLGSLRDYGAAHGLNSLEQVKAITLTSDEFTVAKGLLTPTLKSRRPRLRKYFDADIHRMYRELRNLEAV